MSTIDLDDFPEIPEEVIEQGAADLLEQYAQWSGRPADIPVPVEVIAEGMLGYDLDISDDWDIHGQEWLGGIVFDENVICISPQVEAHEGRYNFTIAHELGHHVLHRQHYIERLGTSILCRESGDKPLVEQQADRFAAALLMPEQNVRAAFAQTVGGSLPATNPTTQALRALAAGVVERGGFVNVSNTAMVNRLIDLRLVSGAHYQTGTSQDFLRREGFSLGLIRYYLRGMLNRLLHPLRAINQDRNKRR